MRRFFLVCLLAVHVVFASANGGQTPAGSTPHTRAASAGGMFHVSYRADAKAARIGQFQRWTIEISDVGGRPIQDAQVRVDGGMPAHGHGLPTIPQVTPADQPGLYLLEGLKFTMPGHWVVDLHIEAGGRTDTVRFELDLP